MMLRDPVKRLFSYCNMVAGKEEAKNYFYHLLTDEQEYFYYSKLYQEFTNKWGFDFWGEEHSKLFFYEKIFSNEDRSEIEKMNEFLGIPKHHYIDVKDYHIKAKYHRELLQKDLEFGRERLRKDYAHIHLIMKYIPDAWEFGRDWNIDTTRYSDLSENYSINPLDHY